MGPLASADFVKTIYESCSVDREQLCPRLILVSDPTFPDRSQALEANQGALLGRLLEDALCKLLAQGATDTVICCVTLHAVLPLVSAPATRGLHSLITAALEGAAETVGRQLLICTSGTRREGIFEAEPLWPSIRDKVILPDASDQQEVHRMIYEMKRNLFSPRHVEFLESLLWKYHAQSYIVGCTEMHAFEKWRWKRGLGSFDCVDPLLILARRIASACAAVGSEICAE
jgi:aspartate racemase